jgi:hypothetical protein
MKRMLEQAVRYSHLVEGWDRLGKIGNKSKGKIKWLKILSTILSD